MKRCARIIVTLCLVVQSSPGWAASDSPQEKSIEQLPKDVWNLAFVWTEPLKQAAERSRQLDPVSGLWFGLLDGSVKSVERVAGMLWDRETEEPAAKQSPPGSPLIRYSF
jgi:hypothetical protein